MDAQAIRVMLADDEPGIRLILRKKIEKTPGFTIVAEAQNGKAALEKFDQLRPDVVFLDVDMPEISGIDCARIIQDKNPKCVLIFATGHEEYMSEAFEVYAFDYLVKPFNMERLQGTLQRILERNEQKEHLLSPKALESMKKRPSRLLLHHKDGVTFLDPAEIILIQREERATVLYTANEGRYVIPDTMQEIEARLDPSLFFRCHKSYIVNIQHIRDITPYGRWTYVIQLDGTKHDALITHDKYEELEKRFS
ncbi:MAG: response regulator transcription factor [Clostridia bacterium]|nr:response regulator transcription factor [Clostridia bacterium]